jgi:hypothetical protein
MATTPRGDDVMLRRAVLGNLARGIARQQRPRKATLRSLRPPSVLGSGPGTGTPMRLGLPPADGSFRLGKSLPYQIATR